MNVSEKHYNHRSGSIVPMIDKYESGIVYLPKLL